MSFHGGPKHRKNKTFVKTEEYFKKSVQSTPTTSLEMRWKRGIGKIIEMVALSITQKGTLSYLILTIFTSYSLPLYLANTILLGHN